LYAWHLGRAELMATHPCRLFIATITLCVAPLCHAAEELITTAQYKNGDIAPYVLNYRNLSPRYVVILFPGGNGNMDPHIEDGKLVYSFKGNFVIRTRKWMIDDEFATAATNSTQSPERIQVILDDLTNRFPSAKIYLMGTSKGTHDTMALAHYLSDKIAGEIHTSSLQSIASFNAGQFKNRQLIVHHRNDGCHATGYSHAEASHIKYGTELITMDGGISIGDPCEPFGHHGFNGIEKETIDAIKIWIKKEN
jgi:hypothetical protein